MLCHFPRTDTSLFFFLMIRRPPKSPLFPYTPLFQSRSEPPWHSCPWRAPRLSFPACSRGVPAASPRRQNRSVRHLSCSDRKITRLNSSHLGIPLGVFCLHTNRN